MSDKANAKSVSPAGGAHHSTYARNLVFYINNQRVEIARPDPTVLLVDYLRSPEVGLTGTKKSCGQGGCGACTVMLSSYDAPTDTVTLNLKS